MLWPVLRDRKTRRSTAVLRRISQTRHMWAEPLEVRNLLTVGITSFAPASVSSGYATSWDVSYQDATPNVALEFAAYESGDSSGSQIGNLLTTYSFTPTSSSGTASIPAVLKQADLQSNYYLVVVATQASQSSSPASFAGGLFLATDATNPSVTILELQGTASSNTASVTLGGSNGTAATLNNASGAGNASAVHVVVHGSNNTLNLDGSGSFSGNVALLGGSSNDTFNVNATLSGAPVTLDGGAGTNTFNVGDNSSSTVSKLAGTIMVNGSGGTNNLNFQAGADTSNAALTLTSSGITASGLTLNTQGTLANLVLYTRTTAAFTATSTLAASTTIYTEANSRTVTVTADGLGGSFGVLSNGTSVNTLIVDASTASATSATIQGGDADHFQNTISGLKSTYNITTWRWAQGSFQPIQILGPAAGPNTFTVNDPTIAVEIDGGSGNDTFTVNSTLAGKAVTLDGGTGTNTFNVGDNTSTTISKLAGNVTVSGSGGTNNLNILAGVDTSDATLTITSSGITASGFTVNTQGSLANLVLYTRTTAGLNVPSTLAASTTIYTEANSRTVTVTAAGLGGHFGVLSNGSSVNTLIVDASTSSATSATIQGADVDHFQNTISGLKSTYNITTWRWAQGSFQPIQILAPTAGANTFTVNGPTVAVEIVGGSGNDTFNVNSTLAGKAVTLDGGAGTNTFDVGDNSTSAVANLAGAITVNGSAGTNNLNVKAGVDTSDATFTITSSGITASGLAINTQGTFGDIYLYTDSTSPVSVTSTLANTTVYAEANARTVTVAMNSLGGNFGVLSDGTAATSLVVDGSGTPANVLTFDSLDPVHFYNKISPATSYYITTFRWAGGTIPSVHVTGLTPNGNAGKVLNINGFSASLEIDGTNKNDTYNISGTVSGAALTLNGDLGNDIFNINDGVASGTIALDGGDGNDTYNMIGSPGATITLADSSGTSDHLSFASLSYSSGVTVDLSNAGAQTVATNGTKSLALDFSATVSGIDRVTGTVNNDSITGDGGKNTIDGKSGTDTLSGGAGDDTFAFSGSPNGTVSIVESDPGSGGGINTLDFSVVSYTAGVDVDLTTTSGSQTVATNGTATLSLNLSQAALAIAGVKGSQYNDSIIADGGDNVLNGFTGSDTLQGGAGDDVYVFIGGPVGTVTIVDSAAGSGGGVNALDFSGVSTTTYALGLTVDISNSSSTQLVADKAGANDATKLYLDLTQASLAIVNVIGSNVADRITGNSSDNVLTGSGGNDTLTGGGGNDTYVSINDNGNRDTIVDTPRADGLFASLSPVFAGSPVTFSLVNPSSSVHYSFAQTEGGLATTYSAAGTSATSSSYTYSSGTYTMWGRVIDSNNVSSTFSTQFTVASGFGIGGPVRTAADSQNQTTNYDLTLFSTDNVASSQWVVNWGDGTSSTYNVSPTSSTPIVESHAYPSQSAIYQVSATVTDTNSNTTNIAPITVEIWGATPLAPQNVRAEMLTYNNAAANHWARVTWDAPFGDVTGWEIQYSLTADASDNWKPFGSGSVPGDNFYVQGIREKYYFRVKFTNGNGSSEWSNVASPFYKAEDAGVTVSAAAQSSPSAQISLSWPLWRSDTAPFTTGYTVDRRVQGTTTWQSLTSSPLASSATSYVDSSVTAGTVYEYRVTRTQNSGSAGNGVGFVVAGVELAVTEGRGKIVLVVDNTFTTSLATELDRLQQDLVGDGWTVIRHDVSRSDSVVSVKNLIKADYNADPTSVKQVFLVGHVPVPYSGWLLPSGHPELLGAWPVDAFYGDTNGEWTDSTVNNSNPGVLSRANVPNDGVYDQSALSGEFAPELAVGRVDMFGMAVANGQNDDTAELAMLSRYLDRDHAFRQGQLTVERRALVDEHMGTNSSGYSFRGFGGLVGESNISGEYWFTTSNNSGTDPDGALWGYAESTGSLTGQSYIGTSDDFLQGDQLAHGPSTVVFTIRWGSYFGYWNPNSLSGSNSNAKGYLRAPLAGPGNGLTAVWGEPGVTQSLGWDFQHMGIGRPIGESVVFSQHRGFSGLADMGVEAALMGDPTLRQDIVAPPTNVAATHSGSDINVTWTASSDGSVLGYNVYRADASGTFSKLNNSGLVTTTSYSDVGAGPYVYMVRAVKLHNGYSGSYYNISQGAFVNWGALILNATSAIDVTIRQSGSNYQVVDNATSNVLVSRYAPITTAIYVTGSSSNDTVIFDASVLSTALALSAVGAGGADSIRLNNAADSGNESYTLTSSGVTIGSTTVTISDADALTVDVGSGTDPVNVQSTFGATTINAGTSTQAITISNQGSLNDITGAVTVNGGSLTIDDSANATNSLAYALSTSSSTAGSLVRTGGSPGTVTINFTDHAVNSVDLAIVSLLSGTGSSDTVTVTKTLGNGVATSVTAGGAGTLTIANSSTLNDILGELTVVGNGGQLIMDDRNATGFHTYQISGTQTPTLTRDGTTTIHYGGFNAVDFYNSNGGSTFNLGTVAASGATRAVLGGNTLNVHGGSGGDHFNVNAMGSGNLNIYAYHVDEDDPENYFNVQGTTSGTTTLTGGEGNDYFLIGAGSHDLANIGSVSVLGGDELGTDSLTVDDSSGNHGTLSNGNPITQSGSSASISYSDVESVTRISGP